jgi:hypothetical protein
LNRSAHGHVLLAFGGNPGRVVGGRAAGPDDDPPWLAAVFVPGPSLAEAVASAGPLPRVSVWKLAAGLVEALQAVHACGANVPAPTAVRPARPVA